MMLKRVFSCKRCNKCCLGEGGVVFKKHELAIASSLLGMELTVFTNRYCRRNGSRYEVLCGQDGYCSLLGPEGCLVHMAKPAICRRWPFFDALIKDSGAFAEAKLACPGLDPIASHADFLLQANQERNSMAEVY